jgi:signal transduction histidine kinase/ActR/RegA family two-component response regulator
MPTGSGVGGPQQREELAEVLEQLRATREVLRTLGRSGSSLDEVFRTVVESAKQLCRGDVAQMHLTAGATYRLAWESGLTEEFVAFMAEHPIFADRRTLVGRVGIDQRAQQIADVLADPEYGATDAQRLGRYRSIIGAPMLVDDEVIGVLSAWRVRVDPFSDRDAELLTDFAAQAAVAVRTAGLVRELEARRVELEARGAELGTKVEQLEALGEVGEAVSSSLDLDEVLTAIVTNAVRLSGTDGGSILEFDPDAEEFRVRTAYGTTAEVLDALRRMRLGLHDTLIGRAALGRTPLQVPDLAVRADDVHLRTLRDAGWRSLVTVPMLRGERIIGALVVRRRTPGAVEEETCEFLQTFASQSALAISNAQLYRRLEQQTAELAVVSQHKSEFLASMSHELRTPLNAIIGFSEVLLERMFGDLNERQDEYLRDILSSGRHLLALLNDILDLSKVEAGQMTLEPTQVALLPLLEGSVGLVRERATRHGLVVQVLVDEDVEDVEADELRLRQVVLNLLTNAVKFTPDRGRIVVRATRVGDEVEVTVADTGVGIPEHDQERIFESFQQGERSRGVAEGTGLGLTLTRRIVQLHGGRLWLASEVGRGSTFGFTMPAGSRRRPGTGPSPQSEGSRRRVLVVEDDRPSGELLTVLLEGHGLQVDMAPSGEQALDALASSLPDAVLLDIRLPGVDGWELLTRLRADPATARLPVLIVSILDERSRALALGADEYIVKPVDREVLMAALRRVGVLEPDGDGHGS